MIRRLTCAWLLAVTAAAWAEGVAEDEAAQPAPEAPLAPVHGTRYRVLLRNGRAVLGVVRVPGIFERRTIDGYQEVDRTQPDAGVRLWWVRGQDGYVFVLAKQVVALDKLGELDEAAGREIAEQRVALERRAVDERDQLRRAREERREAERAAAAAAAAGTAGTGPAAPPVDAAGGPVAPSPAMDAAAKLGRYTALLQRYPPGRWTPETPKDIERRKVLMDLFPTAEEKEFLLVYPDWLDAYTAWKAGQDANATPGETPAPEAAPAKATTADQPASK